MSLIGSLNSGVSALQAFEQGIEVIGNNISNVNTTGYKDETTEYSESFSNMLRDSAPAPSGGKGSNTDAMQIGTGVQIASISSNLTQGALESTGVNTNLAIAGNGYFTVVDPSSNSTYVTRDGDFHLDSNGYLVTSNGDRVQGLSDGSVTYTATDVNGTLTYTPAVTPPSTVGDLQVSYSPTIGNGLVNNTGGAFTDAQVAAGAPSLQNFTVDSSGNVVMSLSNGDTFTSGQVLLQNFSDPNALVSEGNNLYGNLSAAGPIGGSSLTAANNTAGTNGLGSIQSGALEQSNVDLSAEMANLITAERSFQAGSRVITVSDTVLQEIVNLTH
jgi:flagellar hook protein FlgE